LFDLKKDPDEMEDLVDRTEHTKLIADLKNKLLERRAKTSKA